MRILWYVSSHGWGHAARQRELIRVYSGKNSRARIHVCSNVPDWFWKGTLISNLLSGSPAPAIHEDGWHLDLAKTEKSLKNYLETLDENLESEIGFQERQKPDLVISDIDPLPLAAASSLGTRTLAVGNFTWDWIFGGLFPSMERAAKVLKRLYRDAVYLKLPLGPDHSPCRKTVKVPLLRAGGNGSGSIPEDLQVPGRRCLLALRSLPGGIGKELPNKCRAFSSLPVPPGDGVQNILPEALLERGLSFSDLVASADVVVSKAGYGIISQILAMGKRCVIYTGRGFPEEPCLLEPLENRPSTRILSINEKGGLATAVEEVLSDPEPEPNEAEGCDFIVEGGYLDSGDPG